MFFPAAYKKIIAEFDNSGNRKLHILAGSGDFCASAL